MNEDLKTNEAMTVKKLVDELKRINGDLHVYYTVDHAEVDGKKIPIHNIFDFEKMSFLRRK